MREKDEYGLNVVVLTISVLIYFNIIMQNCLYWKGDLFYVKATLETGEKKDWAK